MANPPIYEVTQVLEVVVPDPQGRLTRRTRVHYRLPNGYEGQVEVLTPDATPERVREAIDADAKRILAIYGSSKG